MQNTRFQYWFNNLKRQEQILLLFGAAVVVAYLIFVVVIGPMSRAEVRLQQQNQQAAETLAEVKQLAAQYQLLQKSAGKSGQTRTNLTRTIDSTVKKNSLIMTRFQPSSSGDVQVRFENAVFNNIVAWLYELESENGVVIRDVSITPGAASGLVNVSVRLSNGS